MSFRPGKDRDGCGKHKRENKDRQDLYLTLGLDLGGIQWLGTVQNEDWEQQQGCGQESKDDAKHNVEAVR